MSSSTATEYISPFKLQSDPNKKLKTDFENVERICCFNFWPVPVHCSVHPQQTTSAHSSFLCCPTDKNHRKYYADFGR